MSRIAWAWQKLQFPWDMEGAVQPDRSYLRDKGTVHAFAEQPGNNIINNNRRLNKISFENSQKKIRKICEILNCYLISSNNA